MALPQASEHTQIVAGGVTQLREMEHAASSGDSYTVLQSHTETRTLTVIGAEDTSRQSEPHAEIPDATSHALAIREEIVAVEERTVRLVRTQYSHAQPDRSFDHMHVASPDQARLNSTDRYLNIVAGIPASELLANLCNVTPKIPPPMRVAFKPPPLHQTLPKPGPWKAKCVTCPVRAGVPWEYRPTPVKLPLTPPPPPPRNCLAVGIAPPLEMVCPTTDGIAQSSQACAAVAELPEPFQDALHRPEIDNSEVSDSEFSNGADSTASSTAARASHPQAPAISRITLKDLTSFGNQNSFSSKFETTGNIGIMFGNWGQRGHVCKKSSQLRLRERMDAQLFKSPAQILCLAEASHELAHLLQSQRLGSHPADENSEDSDEDDPIMRTAVAPLRAAVADSRKRCTATIAQTGAVASFLERDDNEYIVCKGGDRVDKTTLLVAARRSCCESIEKVLFEEHHDSRYKEKSKEKYAITSTLICKVTCRNSVGHIGKYITVMVSHLHHKTANGGPQGLSNYFDRMSQYLNTHDVHIWCGDFNMALFEVVPQCRSRGIRLDCIAWCPWLLKDWEEKEKLNFCAGPWAADSCAIFYRGGNAEVRLATDLETMRYLLGFSFPQLLAHDKLEKHKIHTFEHSAMPGQPHKCYAKKNSSMKDKVEALLTPTQESHQLEPSPMHIQGSWWRKWLSFKEKRLSRDIFIVEGKFHNGAHFPLCVFTDNGRRRSRDAEIRRHNKLLRNDFQNRDRGLYRSYGDQTLRSCGDDPWKVEGDDTWNPYRPQSANACDPQSLTARTWEPWGVPEPFQGGWNVARNSAAASSHHASETSGNDGASICTHEWWPEWQSHWQS